MKKNAVSKKIVFVTEYMLGGGANSLLRSAMGRGGGASSC